jgi:tetratricopeptide (TPR) repeat protein
MKKLSALLFLLVFSGSVYYLTWWNKTPDWQSDVSLSTVSPSSSPTSTPAPLPPSKMLESEYHIFQTFNNCGPAALSMTLSYFDINKTQQELGQALRPYQNPQGDNDDKSVTLHELATKAEEFGLISYHRPNGSSELIKQLLAINLPVITRTHLNENDDIGHYRVIKGYDDVTQEFIQDDSLQGHNLRYSYPQFNRLWSVFNYEYLVMAPADKAEAVETILGENVDERTAWKHAADRARRELEMDNATLYDRFNLAVALFHLGEYEKSVSEFEQVETNLPFRTLWYQIEPIQAYYELGNYQRVFEMTDAIFDRQNRAFSELYVIRGDSYQQLGRFEDARREYERAVFYNQHLLDAQEKLTGIMQQGANQ